MTPFEIPLKNLKFDVEGRINAYDKDLERSMLEYGQLEPILVEGPDLNGIYYVVHGYRRYHIMRRNSSRFFTAQCHSIGPVTSQTERNHLRFRLLSTSKRPISVENQFMFEGATPDPDLIKNLSSHQRKKYERGGQIPRDLRESLARKNGSQEALAVFWHDLAIDQCYRDDLVSRLLTSKTITVDHATALKRLAKRPGFKFLNQDQKKFAIETTLVKGKFTENDADLLIIQTVMQDEPAREYADFWVLYVANEIDNLTLKIHENVGLLISDDVRERLCLAKEYLMTKLDCILGGEITQNAYIGNNKSSIQPENKENIQNKKESLADAAKYRARVEFVTSKNAAVPYFEKVGNVIKAIFPERTQQTVPAAKK